MALRSTAAQQRFHSDSSLESAQDLLTQRIIKKEPNVETGIIKKMFLAQGFPCALLLVNILLGRITNLN